MLSLIKQQNFKMFMTVSNYVPKFCLMPTIWSPKFSIGTCPLFPLVLSIVMTALLEAFQPALIDQEFQHYLIL